MLLKNGQVGGMEVFPSTYGPNVCRPFHCIYSCERYCFAINFTIFSHTYIHFLCIMLNSDTQCILTCDLSYYILLTMIWYSVTLLGNFT